MKSEKTVQAFLAWEQTKALTVVRVPDLKILPAFFPQGEKAQPVIYNMRLQMICNGKLMLLPPGALRSTGPTVSGGFGDLREAKRSWH